MDITRTGLILNTENYEACRDFYGSVLELPLLHQIGEGEDEITVFAFGSSYLMVEHEGMSHRSTKPNAVCPTKLRFNVPDVTKAAKELSDKGVEVTIRKHDWGTTGEFADPDGNRCAFRSDKGFGED